MPAWLVHVVARDFIKREVDFMFFREVSERWKGFLASEIRVFFDRHHVDMRLKQSDANGKPRDTGGRVLARCHE